MTINIVKGTKKDEVNAQNSHSHTENKSYNGYYRIEWVNMECRCQDV